MRQYANPFNAGFGVDPPYLAGRDELIHRILADLREGPGRDKFVQVLIGDRGVGKTTVQNHLRQYVTNEFGWSTMRWTASRESPFAAALDDAYDLLRAQLLGPRRRLKGASVGVNAGVVRADIDMASTTRRPATVAGQLRSIGELAAAANRTVVVFVDELQAGDPTSLSSLSTAFQETNGEKLPIALVAAGLPTTKARLRQLTGVTFIERQRPTRLANLTGAESLDALEQPLVDAGRSYDPNILPIMLEMADGYPYALQLVGEHTWDAAGDEPSITPAHARQGVALAQDDLDSIYHGRWDDLTERQRDYLHAVLEHLGPDESAPSSAVAETYGGSTHSASQTRQALINQHQLLYSDAKGSLRFALPGLRDWLSRNITPTTSNIDTTMADMVRPPPPAEPESPGLDFGL